MRQFIFIGALLLSVLLRPAFTPAFAQDQGTAVITTPLDGASIAGIVPILGTATHPQFVRYELAFSYSPNPTDTWFTLQDPALTQVVADQLGQWDTTRLTDGLYVIRLRVYWSDKNFLEAFARNVQVQNDLATAPPTPLPALLPTLTETASPAPAVTATPQAIIVLPPPSTPRPTTNAVIVIGGQSESPSTRLNTLALQNAFEMGVRLTLIIFAGLAVYAGARAALRAWLR